MGNWFTIEEVDKKTFAISEYGHWEQVHSYLLVGREKAILIDTGLGISNIKNEVDKITNLQIQVVTTHVHWDHIGGHKYFENIAVHELEKECLEKFPLPLEVVKNNLMKEKFDVPNDFDINNYSIYSGKPTTILKDNDVIDIGDRMVKVIHTPGHSPGHICLYDINNKYLFTGDLVYEGKLDMFYPTTDPIAFKGSINKIRWLDVNRILPAHYNLNVDKSIIEKIWNAFEKIEKNGNLKNSNTIYRYDKFSIHI